MTKNNNSSMKTVVETFLVEETIELVHDNDQLDKWNERIDQLELVGQKGVSVAKKSPVPFMWMNDALVSTFEVLCPTKEPVTEYGKMPIPVEILDLVSLSKNESYFDEIEIWYNEKSPDHVCIGYKYNVAGNESTWWKKAKADKYLIGRWADVKASLDQLIDRAKNIFVNNENIRLRQMIKQYQRELEDLETTTHNRFGNAMPSTEIPF